MKSGKTAIAHVVSEHLNNAPIISLNDVWKDLIDNKPDAKAEDYINELSKCINVGDCIQGFIIDGIDAILPEPPETDQYLAHCMKSKNSDTTKNPFVVIPHSVPTSSEQVLSYILSALDGHYVFHIAINANEDVVVARDEKIKNEEKLKEKIKEEKAKEDLFLMTEEQYLALSEGEREEVDKKRQSVRQNLLQAAFDSEEPSGKVKKTRSSSSKHKSHHSKDKDESETASGSEKKHKSKHRSKSATDEKSKEKDKSKDKSKDKDKNDNDSSSQKKKKVSGVPTEPIPKSILTFKYTLGSIVQKIQNSGGTFQVIDPTDLTQEDKNEEESAREEKETEFSSETASQSDKGSVKQQKQLTAADSSEKNDSDASKTNKKSHKKKDQTVTQIDEDKDEMLVTKLANPKLTEEEEEEKTEAQEIKEIKETKDIKDTKDENNNEFVLPSFAHKKLNTLLIDIGPSNDEIKTAITRFLPNIQQIEEKAFTRLIPPPRMIMPSFANKRKSTTASQMPLYFSIINDEAGDESDSSSFKFRPDSHQKPGRKSRAGKSKNNDPLQDFYDEHDASKFTQRF